MHPPDIFTLQFPLWHRHSIPITCTHKCTPDVFRAEFWIRRFDLALLRRHGWLKNFVENYQVYLKLFAPFKNRSPVWGKKYLELELIYKLLGIRGKSSPKREWTNYLELELTCPQNGNVVRDKLLGIRVHLSSKRECGSKRVLLLLHFTYHITPTRSDQQPLPHVWITRYYLG